MIKAFRIVVFLSGRGSNLRALYEYIVGENLPIEIARVICDKQAAPGLKYAEERGIPSTYVPRKPKEESPEQFHQRLIQAAAAENPDLVVLAGFMRILSAEFIEAFRGKIVNIHPSLLPAFRGLHAQRQALDAGVRIAGCTVHFVTEELDGGPIVAQAGVPVLPADTEETLSDRILTQEHRIYPLAIRAIAEGKVSLGSDGSLRFKNLTIDEKDFLCSL